MKDKSESVNGFLSDTASELEASNDISESKVRNISSDTSNTSKLETSNDVNKEKSTKEMSSNSNLLIWSRCTDSKVHDNSSDEE